MEIFFLEEIVTDMVLLNKKLHSNYQNSIRFKIGNVMLFPFSQFIEKLRYRSAKVKFKKNESAKN
jgi:hypothetical protein